MMEMHSFLKAKATEIPSPDDEENVSACDLFGFLFRKTLIISKKPGNTGISRDMRTEFTTHLLHSD